MVKQFYRDVSQLPQISDQAIGDIMQQLSIRDEFDTIAALKELYIYVTKYRDQASSNFIIRKMKIHLGINREFCNATVFLIFYLGIRCVE